MTLFDALRHQWRRRLRSPTVGRSLVGALLLLLAAAYFGSLFVAAGWFYPQVVAKVAPEADPLRLLNESLLYAAVGLTVLRFFLQRSAGSDVRPYLHLPLRRPQVVRVMQVLSALSLLNLLPIVVLASLWGSTVLPEASAGGAACWAVGALLLVATTQFLNSLLRAVWDRNAGIVLGAAGLLAVVVAGCRWLGVELLHRGSAWLFGELAAGAGIPLLVLTLGAVGTARAAHRALRGRLYSVLGEAGASRAQTLGMLRGRGREWGRTVALALLDLKLILRNKRSRQMLGAGLFVIGPFLFIILSGEEIPPMNEVIFGFLLSGYLGLAYTQFSYAWHGTHFDGLLVQATPLRGFVQAQFLTFAGLCVGPLLLVAPIIAGVRPHLLVPIGALLLYNLGVTAPVLLGVGVLGRTALQVDQSAFFNYQGTSTYHFLVVLPIMGLPVGLLIGLSLSTTLYVATGLGVFGLAMAPLWMRGVGWMLRAQRHAMATGFRDE